MAGTSLGRRIRDRAAHGMAAAAFATAVLPPGLHPVAGGRARGQALRQRVPEQTKGVGTSAIDLATTDGATAAMGGAYPAASVLARTDRVNAHKATVQKVVDALVATMHCINTHSAADVANRLPASFVSNQLVTRADYISALNEDKGQFLQDGLMPADGPATSLATEKPVGNVKGSVDLSKTSTNDFAIQANKTEGFKTTTTPAGPNG
ncbi:hypothetical protein [Streptomyces sp. NBC_01518]|uniref:hypothetical protein n=1 Tax=Streptomyces sp. NBC_01518 TaxID=2903891 RepID=UPI003867821C